MFYRYILLFGCKWDSLEKRSDLGESWFSIYDDDIPSVGLLYVASLGLIYSISDKTLFTDIDWSYLIYRVSNTNDYRGNIEIDGGINEYSRLYISFYWFDIVLLSRSILLPTNGFFVLLLLTVLNTILRLLFI